MPQIGIKLTCKIIASKLMSLNTLKFVVHTLAKKCKGQGTLATINRRNEMYFISKNVANNNQSMICE